MLIVFVICIQLISFRSFYCTHRYEFEFFQEIFKKKKIRKLERNYIYYTYIFLCFTLKQCKTKFFLFLFSFHLPQPQTIKQTKKSTHQYIKKKYIYLFIYDCVCVCLWCPSNDKTPLHIYITYTTIKQQQTHSLSIGFHVGDVKRLSAFTFAAWWFAQSRTESRFRWASNKIA